MNLCGCCAIGKCCHDVSSDCRHSTDIEIEFEGLRWFLYCDCKGAKWTEWPEAE